MKQETYPQQNGARLEAVAERTFDGMDREAVCNHFRFETEEDPFAANDRLSRRDPEENRQRRSCPACPNRPTNSNQAEQEDEPAYYPAKPGDHLDRQHQHEQASQVVEEKPVELRLRKGPVTIEKLGMEGAIREKEVMRFVIEWDRPPDEETYQGK